MNPVRNTVLLEVHMAVFNFHHSCPYEILLCFNFHFSGWSYWSLFVSLFIAYLQMCTKFLPILN